MARSAASEDRIDPTLSLVQIFICAVANETEFAADPIATRGGLTSHPVKAAAALLGEDVQLDDLGLADGRRTAPADVTVEFLDVASRQPGMVDG
jgi:hypothetical protein